MKFPNKLSNKLNIRKGNKAIRSLEKQTELIDFSSNDYLGFAKSEEIFDKTHQFLVDKKIKQNGAGGSRLLSGNHNLYLKVEELLGSFFQSETATIFNSGYDANIGFFSCVPQRGDIILYDEFIHASIRDGIQLSNAKSFKFKHNNLEDLEKLILRYAEFSSASHQEIFVVTEAVFSMDGDSPDLTKMLKIIKKNNAFFIVDEAHSVGVFNKGLIEELNLQNEVFARIVTFGKALGCHGSAILGSKKLQQYLVNFARSFIYTTALPPHSLATINFAFRELINQQLKQQKLQENITYFLSEVNRNNLNFIESYSAIHSCIIGGNEQTKNIAEKLQQKGFAIKPILSPTVPKNKERLRFCLHSYNSKEEISEVLCLLSKFVN